MMKTNLLLCGILALLTLTTIHAQKLRDKTIVFKHVSMPSSSTPLDYTTYSVEATGEVLQVAGYTSENFAKDIKMQGFKRVNGYGGSAGHLHLFVDLGYLTAGKPEFKTHTEKVKDKAGNETVVKSYFWAVPFQGQYSAKVINPEGSILKTSSGTYNQVLTTSRVRNAEALRKSESKYVNNLTVDAARDIKQDAYSIAEGLIRSFDYRKTSTREQFYLIKKHATEDQWEKHFEIVKENFEAASHYPNVESLREKLAPSIAFYEKMSSKNPKGDKKQLRIYKAAILNLATIYFYLDDLTSASLIMDGASDQLAKDNRANGMASQIRNAAKKMNSSGIKTIYYMRDLTHAFPPGKQSSIDQHNEELTGDGISTKGYIIQRSVRVNGEFIVDKDADDLIFGKEGNVKFIRSKNGVLEEVDLLRHGVSEIHISDRVFKEMKFAPSAKGETNPSDYILEEIYISDRISLYKYYPQSGVLSGEKHEFAFKKKGEEIPVSLESTPFLFWEKGLAKYFSDCPDLAEMASEGAIVKTKDSLLKAARVYSEICSEVIKP